MATSALEQGGGLTDVASAASRSWIVPALFCLALGLRLVLMLALPQPPLSDGEFYFLRAAEIASGQGYQEAGHPTAFWPVGYPALLAAAMLLFGKTTFAAMILNLIAAAGILYLILWFGRHVAGSELAGRLGALLYALYPAHVVYTGVVISETSYTAVTMAAFALLIAKRGDWRWLILAGLIFGFASLMRTQTILYPVGAIIALAAVYRDYRWRDATRAALIVHLAMAAVILPWSLRNERVFGEFVLVSTNGGIALLTGANDFATGDHMYIEKTPVWAASGIPFEQRVQRQVEIDRRFKRMAREWISENPGRFAALGVKKAVLIWRKDSDAFWLLKSTYPRLEQALTAAQWVNQLYFKILLALAAICFVAAARALLRGDEGRKPLGLLLCMPIFVTLLAFFFTGQIRYHYPAMPFIVIAAGWTLAMLLERRRRAEGADATP